MNNIAEEKIISSIRLTSQQLSAPDIRHQTPKEIVAWMGAVQAQNFGMAKWALGVRIPGCTNNVVEDAFNKGEIIRTHILRPTWHFVTSDNLRWMLGLTAPKIQSSSKSWEIYHELTDEIYRKCFGIIFKILENNNHLTRQEIAVEMERSKIRMNNSRISQIMFRAELNGIVCSGALKNKEQTYALMDERIPASAPLHRDEALARLTRIYFTSHSPATIEDFVWWSGLSLTEARKGIESVKEGFITEKLMGRNYWIANEFASIKKSDDSLLLLPAFDEYIISYKYRDAVIRSLFHSQVISKNGIFCPVILENGIVIGTWKKAVSKNKPPILTFFEEQDFPNQQRMDRPISALNVFLS